LAKHLPPRSTVSSYFLRWEVSIEIAKRSDIGQFVALPNG
jgi:hypothetical protein